MNGRSIAILICTNVHKQLLTVNNDRQYSTEIQIYNSNDHESVSHRCFITARAWNIQLKYQIHSNELSVTYISTVHKRYKTTRR